jgi:hypothetical protein
MLNFGFLWRSEVWLSDPEEKLAESWQLYWEPDGTVEEAGRSSPLMVPARLIWVRS